MVTITIDVQFLVKVYCFCSQVLSAIAYICSASKASYVSIRVGCSPEHWRRWGCWGSYRYNNEDFFLAYNSIFFTIFSIFFALVEIGILVKFKYAKLFRKNYIRGIVYILKGIATLGVTASLGIAAGILEIIGGCAQIILELLVRCNKVKDDDGE